MKRNVGVDALVNASGLALHAIDYGSIITSLTTLDRDGALADIVLGHDRLDGYRPNPAYLGAIIGRVANRLRNARYTNLAGHDAGPVSDHVVMIAADSYLPMH